MTCSQDEILQGGLYAAITHYVKECFETELNQIKFGKHIIIFKRSKHLLGSLIMDTTDKIDAQDLEVGLNDILEHIETNCPEFETEKYDSKKIETLVNQYITKFS